MTAPGPPETLAWWDERAALHGRDDVYDTDAVVAGASTLYRVDHDVVGDVAGRDLLHLQCHIGLDTVSWARAGARRAVGVDFSPVAVAKATAITAAAGLTDTVQFVEADVLDLPAELHGVFDVCHASRGVFSWVADLTRWMRQAALTLRPGGLLAVTDLHPLYLMCGGVDPLLLDFPYADAGPIRMDDQTGSYVAGAADTVHNATVEYAHSLGELVTAAVDAGLVVERLDEHLAVETDAHRDLVVRGADGRLRWQVTGQDLPVMFGLRARRPRSGREPAAGRPAATAAAR